jgi:adenosylmethionine-8-amino-7-oxononanoate aminotransferase
MDDFLRKDKEYIWHPFTPLEGGNDPLLITSAEGLYLHTHDGRRIMDAISSWWVNLHGHANIAITRAVAEQAAVLEHVIFAGFTHPPAIHLAENLLSILPSNQSKIFFSDNGSTAVEVGLKMALQYWHNRGIHKKKIIAIHGAYHGDTFGAMSVGDRSTFTKPFARQLFEVDFIDFPSVENEERTIKHFTTLAESGEAGAFIFEPLVQAAGGMRMYSAGCLDRLLSIAKKNNILCIADEVFTGFGRTGEMFACDHLGNSPDIIALSKGLTGGTLPLGATSCSFEVTKAFQSADAGKTFFHGHSYTANPLACAAANASFELLKQPACHQNILRIGKKHREFLETLKMHKAIKDGRSLGTILALELAAGESSYFNSIRTTIYPFFLERNILLRPLGNVIYVLPPYVIADEELDYVYRNIEEFAKKVLEC